MYLGKISQRINLPRKICFNKFLTTRAVKFLARRWIYQFCWRVVIHSRYKKECFFFIWTQNCIILFFSIPIYSTIYTKKKSLAKISAKTVPCICDLFGWFFFFFFLCSCQPWARDGNVFFVATHVNRNVIPFPCGPKKTVYIWYMLRFFLWCALSHIKWTLSCKIGVASTL